ncbi:MAG: hypothetical protein QOI65_1747 [Thermoleophilaceae bacterium]|nr:hypothetical protein [Thermoleophilaceae bacterium]
MNAPLIIEAEPLPTPAPLEIARRAADVAGRLTLHLARARLSRRAGQASSARAVRRAFEELGGTFAKFGQLVASSPSVFGETVAQEFRGSLDAAPPEPFAAVRDVIERELDCPLEARFATFQRQPLASASLAVVHRATLLDGTPVAVKVLRPDIARRIATDLAIMRPLARIVAREVAVGVAGTVTGIVDGLEAQITEELDLRNEARSLRWFAGALEATGTDSLRVPAVHDDCSGRRVLTMEFLDGVPIDDVAAIAQLGIDPVPLVHTFIRTWLATALCTGTFHGDVHAGNLLVCTDGTLALLDWGIVGRLDTGTETFFRRMIEGVLGDENAWTDVAAHMQTIYGPGVAELLGLDDAGFATFLRSQIEPFFQLPFGELNLRTMLLGDGVHDGKHAGSRTRSEALRNWWQQRTLQKRRWGDSAGSFDRPTFLLSKQLVYFERYGKLFLHDTPLLDDAEAFRALLDAPRLR